MYMLKIIHRAVRKNESSQEYGNRGSKERREGNGIQRFGKDDW